MKKTRLNYWLPRSWYDQIAGFGLGGTEVSNPPVKFTNKFAEYRKRGFKITVHAGEECLSTYVSEAAQLLKTDRIDHGISVPDDPELVDYLVAQQTLLTVCPLSK